MIVTAAVAHSRRANQIIFFKNAISSTPCRHPKVWNCWKSNFESSVNSSLFCIAMVRARTLSSAVSIYSSRFFAVSSFSSSAFRWCSKAACCVFISSCWNVYDKLTSLTFFTTKPTGQGTGLGLSLTYDIIKAHRWAIKVESKEGEETEFRMQLPVSWFNFFTSNNENRMVGRYLSSTLLTVLSLFLFSDFLR